MPYTVRKNRGKDTYSVKVTATGKVLAFATKRPESVIRAVEFSKWRRENPDSASVAKWRQQRWQNLTARITDGAKPVECGKTGPKQRELSLPSVCRPKAAAENISKTKIKKAVAKKLRGERIIWNML